MKVTVSQFLHLKKAGAFAQYGKSELLDGEMSGVPLQSEDEPESDASISIPLRVQDYLALDAAGLLQKTVKTELIDGVLYEMSPQYRPHWYIKNELTYRLRRALEEVASPLYAGSEGSVIVSTLDLSEPDIIVTSEPMGMGPIPISSVRLLVEVADTTRSYDLGLKARIYSAAGLPEYWVVDLPDRKVHQFWAPNGDVYGQRREQPFGELLESKTMPLAITLPE
jgi:Uma2 family endonuclease